MYLRLIAIFVLVLGAMNSAQTTQPVDPQLADIDRRAAQIKDLSAKFEQEKHSPLLKKPIVSSGKMMASGGQMLWTTESPRKSRMRVDATSIQILYLQDKVMEIYPMEGKLAKMAANPIARLDSLREQFQITITEKNDKEVHLLLKPVDKKLGEYVEQVVVTLDVQSAVLTRFELTDPDGEKTVIRFSDYKVNAGLTDEMFNINAPDGTKIVRPLDGVR